MDTSWVQFAGVELVNAARTARYAGRAGISVSCAGCPDLPASLGDDPYVSPEQDPAPWFDPRVPESPDFCGLVLLETTGGMDGTTERSAAEFLGDGAALGAARAASREIEFTVLAVAASQAGLSYGRMWLESALRGSACGTGCGGDTLCVYAACPQRPLLPTGQDEDCGTGSGIPDPEWDPVTGSPHGPGGDQLVRQLHDVALTEGPTVDETRRISTTQHFAKLSFTLTAGNPWWWQLPRRVLDQDRPPDYTDVLEDYDILAAAGDCPTPPDCLAGDPYCSGGSRPWPDEPFPGSQPGDLTLIDPCYPTSLFRARRAMWRVPLSATPEWAATAPVFRIRSGDLPLHRITLRWYPNPRRRVPTGSLDPCSACAELTVPWISSRTELVIDSRTRTATVNCRNQGTTASRVRLYGPRGGAYTWPEFDCGTPMIAELLALDASLTPRVRWSVELAARTGAI